eukprot:Nk52_evm38s152 gene=Nk52_evmTU38s152
MYSEVETVDTDGGSTHILDPSQPPANGGMRRRRRSSVHDDVRQKAHALLSSHHNLASFHKDATLESHKHVSTNFFRGVPKTGVIYVMLRAKDLGFTYGDESWANLGQGAPECGPIENQPEREWTHELDIAHQEYAPVDGMVALRTAIANYYNEIYRKDKAEKYTHRNVCVTPGGRSGITRIMACLNHINVGYMLPDYTAYEELLACWKRISPIPILHEKSTVIPVNDLRREIRGRGLGCVLLSNPCNPTGQLIEKETLSEWVALSRKEQCLFIMDEFYSHFIYTHDESENGRMVSSAQYVEKVNKDPILIVDGLTKNWRCPGWRITWVVGPEDYIDKLGAAGSFLDGGANNPLQKEAVKLMDIDFIKKDAKALQDHFRKKRDYMVDSLTKAGITIEHEPQGTFYLWANLENLPYPLNDGVAFFEEALKEKVICVPGIFFDINPGRRRQVKQSPFLSYVRFSYGPHSDNMEKAVGRIENLIKKWKHTPLPTGYIAEDSEEEESD